MKLLPVLLWASAALLCPLFGEENEEPKAEPYGSLKVQGTEKVKLGDFPFETSAKLGLKVKFPGGLGLKAGLDLKPGAAEPGLLEGSWKSGPWAVISLGYGRPGLLPSTFTGGRGGMRGSESRLEDWLKDQGYRFRGGFASLARGYDKGTLPLAYSLEAWFDDTQYSPLNAGSLSWFWDGKDNALFLWGAYQPFYADDLAGARQLRRTGLGGLGFRKHAGDFQAEGTFMAGTDRPQATAPGAVPETGSFAGGTLGAAWRGKWENIGTLRIGAAASLVYAGGTVDRLDSVATLYAGPNSWFSFRLEGGLQDSSAGLFTAPVFRVLGEVEF